MPCMGESISVSYQLYRSWDTMRIPMSYPYRCIAQSSSPRPNSRGRCQGTPNSEGNKMLHRRRNMVHHRKIHRHWDNSTSGLWQAARQEAGKRGWSFSITLEISWWTSSHQHLQCHLIVDCSRRYSVSAIIHQQPWIQDREIWLFCASSSASSRSIQIDGMILPVEPN